MATLIRDGRVVFGFPLPFRIAINGVAEESAWTTMAKDLIDLAACISMTDRMFRRSRHSLKSRTLKVLIPVREPARWKNTTSLLVDVLKIVTNDNWEIDFSKKSVSSSSFTHSQNRFENRSPIQRVVLFSGGLDSAVAAARFAKDGPPCAFVTHYVRSIRRQELLLTNIYSHFKHGADPCLFRFYICPIAEEGIRLVEHSRRSRPFLFGALAGATAIATQAQEVCVCENGPLALNLPLDSSKMPTRHAHSQFLVAMEELITKLVGRQIRFFNPFELTTKGKMTRIFSKTPEMALSTTSCWNQQWAGRGLHYGYGHCGYCLPCLVRRVSLQSAGIAIPINHFDMDPRFLPAKRMKRADFDKTLGPLRSLRSFVERIEATRSLSDFMCEFSDVIDTQPTYHSMSSDEWFKSQYLMMKLFVKEVRAVF